MEIIIVSGLSGAGKSKALSILEDIGYYCIDNIMPELIPNIIDTCIDKRKSAGIDKLAIGVDARGGVFFNGIFAALEHLRFNNIRYKLLYMEAQDDVLVNRYKETRREHPLSLGGRIINGIAKEREMLLPLRNMADIFIDTSHINDNELKQKIYNTIPKRFVERADVTIVTFGFKRGTPTDCDYIFDVRFLPNPHHEPSLKPFNGTNTEVRDYVFASPLAQIFVDNAGVLVSSVLKEYNDNVKTPMMIGIGCTGGKHRSVATACALADFLREKAFKVSLIHRELFMD